MGQPPVSNVNLNLTTPHGAAGVAAQPRVKFEACPLCAATSMHVIKEADCRKHPLYNPIVPARMVWMKCDACKHVFTDGHFNEAQLKALFGRANPHQTVSYSTMERQRVVSSRIVSRVARFVSSGAWLDVGFGDGSLLFSAHEWGFEPVGIELREQNVAELARRGIEAHCVHLEKLDHDARYSVISMADVLEHIPFPKPALAAVRRLIRSDGILFISMPAADTMLWKEWDRQNANPFWFELEHYHNFSRDSLYRLLREMGFEPFNYDVSERYRGCMEVLARAG